MLKVNDFVVVRYYIPENSRFRLLDDYYYGKVVKVFEKSFDYQVFGKCTGKKEKIVFKTFGDYKTAMFENVLKINQPFGWDDIKSWK